jgi:hypothetical protein
VYPVLQEQTPLEHVPLFEHLFGQEAVVEE